MRMISVFCLLLITAGATTSCELDAANKCVTSKSDAAPTLLQTGTKDGKLLANASMDEEEDVNSTFTDSKDANSTGDEHATSALDETNDEAEDSMTEDDEDSMNESDGEEDSMTEDDEDSMNESDEQDDMSEQEEDDASLAEQDEEDEAGRRRRRRRRRPSYRRRRPSSSAIPLGMGQKVDSNKKIRSGCYSPRGWAGVYDAKKCNAECIKRSSCAYFWVSDAHKLCGVCTASQYSRGRKTWADSYNIYKKATLNFPFTGECKEKESSRKRIGKKSSCPKRARKFGHVAWAYSGKTCRTWRSCSSAVSTKPGHHKWTINKA